MKRVNHKTIEIKTKECLLENGANEFSAESVSKGLVETSLRGVDSHGIRLFPHYVNALRNGRVNGEFYVDSCINDALLLGYKCHVFDVDHYFSWGTPNELRTFEYWQSCFHKWKSHEYSWSGCYTVIEVFSSLVKFTKLEHIDALRYRSSVQ